MKKIRDMLERGILLSPDFKDKNVTSNKIDADEKLVLSLESNELYDKEQIKQEPEDSLQTPNILGNKPLKLDFIEHYPEKNAKKTIKDFIKLYNSRYLEISKILRERQELANSMSIHKVFNVQENQEISIIGIVFEKKITKNNNILLKLEDQTGIISAVVTKRNKQCFELAKEITQDEVIGVHAAKGNKILFVNKIIFPEIPLNKEFKKLKTDAAAVFISDVHVGSKYFLEEAFERFIDWISGKTGTPEQQKLASLVEYLFIVGDLVEGIGIYPGQEKDLQIQDIFDQYKTLSEYIKKIPKNIQIIICPGNHDTVRVAEPQPPISRDILDELIELPNVIQISSPGIVRLSDDSSYLDILLYHGFSFPYYASNIDVLRMNGGLEAVDEIMTYLIRKRHLAPTHGSTQYQLGYEGDPLVIKQIPDFFVTGHIHRAAIKNYRKTTLLNCSCWISQTDYQEKRGLNPIPGKAIYVDLSTRNAKFMNFLS